ncbi:MAG: hypothetical protein ACFFAY_03380 [Promethearchaeota archaeon]
MSWRESSEHAGTDIRCGWCGRRPDGPVVYMRVRYCSPECTAAAEMKKNARNARFYLIVGVISILYAAFIDESAAEIAALLLIPALFLSIGSYSLFLVRVGRRYQHLRDKYVDPLDDSPSWPYHCVWCGKEEVADWYFDGSMRPYCSLECRSTENMRWNACLGPVTLLVSIFFYWVSTITPTYSIYPQLMALLIAVFGIYLLYTIALGAKAKSKRASC